MEPGSSSKNPPTPQSLRSKNSIYFLPVRPHHVHSPHHLYCPTPKIPINPPSYLTPRTLDWFMTVISQRFLHLHNWYEDWYGESLKENDYFSGGEVIALVSKDRRGQFGGNYCFLIRDRTRRYWEISSLGMENQEKGKHTYEDDEEREKRVVLKVAYVGNNLVEAGRQVMRDDYAGIKEKTDVAEERTRWTFDSKDYTHEEPTGK